MPKSVINDLILIYNFKMLNKHVEQARDTGKVVIYSYVTPLEGFSAGVVFETTAKAVL